MTDSKRTAAIDQHLPLKPADYLTLIALAEANQHGYGLVKKIQTLSGGTLKLVPSTCHSVLQRLLNDRLLDESAREPAADRDHRRRRY